MKKLFKKYGEIISYLFWGVLTTVVSWGTYSVFALLFASASDFSLFGLQISPAVLGANLLSWICAVLFAFITNKIFVFRSRSFKGSILWPELWKFISARLVTGILEIIAVPLLEGLGLDIQLFGIEGSLAKIIVSVVIVILNYVFSKLFVFKNKAQKKNG